MARHACRITFNRAELLVAAIAVEAWRLKAHRIDIRPRRSVLPRFVLAPTWNGGLLRPLTITGQEVSLFIFRSLLGPRWLRIRWRAGRRGIARGDGGAASDGRADL